MQISRPQTLLVVEDSDDDFHATMRAFKKAGLSNPVQRCTNGDQALDYLFRRGEFADPADYPMPSLILLDLNLPGTDGREVLRVLKADPVLHRLPVIVLTTSNAEQDIQRCYDYGANSYMQKPVDLEGLVVAMTRLKEFWLEIAVLPREGGAA
jgi:two-component system response regulator